MKIKKGVYIDRNGDLFVLSKYYGTTFIIDIPISNSSYTSFYGVEHSKVMEIFMEGKEYMGEL